MDSVAALLGCQWAGESFEVNRPAAIWDADEGSLCFLSAIPNDLSELSSKPGLVIVLPEAEAMLRDAGYNVLPHDEPKFAFCKVVHELMRSRPQPGVHPTAILSSGTSLGRDVTIGPYCVLEGEITLGDGVVLESGINLYNNVSIEAGTTVRSGSRIGYDPFSFGIHTSGEAYLFPAYGGVRIGSFVEIFHNVSIARGVASDTIIEDWVRVGNQAHIGNSVIVENGTTVCAQTDISAQVRIGPRCWIAQSAAIRQKLSIGADTVIGMGAVVVKDVPANVTVTGVPARVNGDGGGLI